MTSPTLHYVHDPLCGWCYAADPLVRAASAAGVRIILHGGGLWDPATNASDAKRRMMRETDAHIARLTGQVFGPAYLDGLLVDPASTWWSRPTIAAVLAAETVRPGAGVATVAAIQHAHYVEGRRVADDAVLMEVASTLGLGAASFRQALAAAPVDAHVADTRALMRHHGISGFPGFLLEREGRLQHLPHEGCYGRPEAFVASVRAAAAVDRRVSA